MERKKQIAVRLSDDEYAALKTAADTVGMSVSDYIRSTASKGIEKIVYDPEMDAAIRDIHESARRIAAAIQELCSKTGESLADYTVIRLAESKVLELNKKLRFIEENIKEYFESKAG